MALASAPTAAEFCQLLAAIPGAVDRETRAQCAVRAKRPALTCQDLMGWRARMQMTQVELAGELDLDVSTIRRYERGIQSIPLVVSLALDTLQLDLG